MLKPSCAGAVYAAVVRAELQQNPSILDGVIEKVAGSSDAALPYFRLAFTAASQNSSQFMAKTLLDRFGSAVVDDDPAVALAFVATDASYATACHQSLLSVFSAATLTEVLQTLLLYGESFEAVVVKSAELMRHGANPSLVLLALGEDAVDLLSGRSDQKDRLDFLQYLVLISQTGLAQDVKSRLVGNAQFFAVFRAQLFQTPDDLQTVAVSVLGRGAESIITRNSRV